jgi:hypothetical protein
MKDLMWSLSVPRESYRANSRKPIVTVPYPMIKIDVILRSTRWRFH